MSVEAFETIEPRLASPVRGWRGGAGVERRVNNLSEFYPDLLEQIILLQIAGFHYTGSLTIPGVLSHGLRPRDYLAENNLPFANGFNDSYGNRFYVSFHEWQYVDDLEYYVRKAREFRQSHRENLSSSPPQCITPLTAAMVASAIQHIHGTIERDCSKPQYSEEQLREHFSLRYERIDLLRAARNYLDSLKALDLPPSLIALATANVPTVYMVTAPEPDKVVIPRSDYHTEYRVQNGVPPSVIKIILVPSRTVPLLKRVLDDMRVDEHIQVFPIEPFVQY